MKCMADRIKDYQLLSTGRHYAHFRFQGSFKEQKMIWDVRLHALPAQGSRQQTMKIETDDREKTVNAELYLAITKVTEAEILKSMIMIRNYKKLKPGVHEWTG